MPLLARPVRTLMHRVAQRLAAVQFTEWQLVSALQDSA
jgi:hypothetical protein